MFSIVRKAVAAGSVSCMISALLLSASWAQDATRGVSEDKVITLGTWAPRSGPLAGLGSSGIDGAYLAFDQVNEAGGVNGYKIKVVEVDDGYEPGRTVAAARKLWEQDNAFLIFFPYGSVTTKAASRYVLDNNIPLLFTFGGADVFHHDPANQPANVYSSYPFFEQLVYSVAQYAVSELDDKKIGVVYNHGEFGESAHRALKGSADRFGYELGLEIGYALNETNFVSIGRKIAAEANDATLIWTVVGGLQVMAAAEQAGYKGDWLIPTTLLGRSAEAQYRKITSLANRIYLPYFQKLQNDESPEIQEFVQQIGQKFPDADVNIALIGNTDAKVFIEALDRATRDGTPLTWPSFQAALETIDQEDIGASVKLSYANGNHIGNTNGRIYKWDGDNWAPVTEFAPLPEHK